MLRRSSILALLLTAVVSHAHGQASGGPAAPALDQAITQGDITIQLPKGWSSQTRGNALLVAFSPNADKDDAGEFVTNFTIASKPATGKIDGDAQQKLLQRDFPDYRTIERPALVTIGNLQGLSFGGTFSSNNLKLRSRQYLFTVGNQVYILTTTGLASKWRAYVPQIEASVATFTVKNAQLQAAPQLVTPTAPSAPAPGAPPRTVPTPAITTNTPPTPPAAPGGTPPSPNAPGRVGISSTSRPSR